MTRVIRHAPANVSRLIAFLVLVALVAASTGCSAVGLGVGTAAGASSVRWRTVDVETSPPLSGEAVRAHFVSRGRYQWVEGTYAGVRNGLLVVSTAEEPTCEGDEPRADGTTREEPRDCLIPLQSLLELRVPHGTHWKLGMGIGAAIGGAIDLAVTAVVLSSFRGPIH